MDMDFNQGAYRHKIIKHLKAQRDIQNDEDDI